MKIGYKSSYFMKKWAEYELINGNNIKGAIAAIKLVSFIYIYNHVSYINNKKCVSYTLYVQYSKSMYQTYI